MKRIGWSRLVLPGIRRRLAPRLAPLVAVMFLAGCLATSVQVRTGGGDTAGILVKVFADADAAKEGRANATGTLVEIYRLDGDQETFLQRSLAGEWGLDGLLPGKYRLRVVAVLDAGGNIREVRSGDRETDVKLKPGQTAEVKVILKKTPTGLIVAAAVTVDRGHGRPGHPDARARHPHPAATAAGPSAASGAAPPPGGHGPRVGHLAGPAPAGRADGAGGRGSQGDVCLPDARIGLPQPAG